MLDISIRKYIDVLEGVFMVRTLQPWFTNIEEAGETPKGISAGDTGILHSLISIQNMSQLLSHPKLGASWEGFALDNL